MGELSKNSALQIVPLLLKQVECKSVVDVGCGDGTWLEAFREFGVTDVVGVDGSYVDKKTLKIPHHQFLEADLVEGFKLDRRFDLVVSLEVGEHLPSIYAEAFVECLTQLGPVVLFSAAVPGQGGVSHVNEQWPEYWAKLFANHDFVLTDCIRKDVWQNHNVAFWYAQNTFLYVHSDYLHSHSNLQAFVKDAHAEWLKVIHPDSLAYKNLLLSEATDFSKMTLRQLVAVHRQVLSSLPKAIARNIKHRLDS